MKNFFTLHNNFYRIPIKTKKEVEHSSVSRGTYDVLYKDDLVLVSWKDNKAVYMACNTLDVLYKDDLVLVSWKDNKAVYMACNTLDVLYTDDLVLVSWKDNKAVYMASNTHGAAVKKSCRRYSRKDKREIMVRICISNFKYVLKNY
jgi:hypothetical protein